jgi:hypothetical protein
VELLEVPVVLALAAIAVYVLAILLRVSCSFCGVTIPALGRAYFAAGLSAILTAGASLFLFALTNRLLGYHPPLDTFSAGLLTFIANGVISTLSYAPLLETRLGSAFNVWLVQAVVFVGFGLLIGCCAGVVSLV